MKKAIIILLVLLVILLFATADQMGNTGLISDTRYAAQYSEYKFRQVRLGMSEQEVLALLGPPLYQDRPYSYPDNNPKKHFIRYGYSESPSGTHYHLRQVCMDRGKVAEITSYFYID